MLTYGEATSKSLYYLINKAIWKSLLHIAILLFVFEAGASSFDPPIDMAEARALCDELPLTDVEGIWRYPDDDACVILLRDKEKEGTYGLWIVQSTDCRLTPGSRIGTLTASPDPNKFRLSLFTSLKRGKYSDPLDCMLTLNTQKEALIIERTGISISFNPMAFFSGFWRTLRLKINNASKKVPEGMIRVYPSYDADGSQRRNPRYL